MRVSDTVIFDNVTFAPNFVQSSVEKCKYGGGGLGPKITTGYNNT